MEIEVIKQLIDFDEQVRNKTKLAHEKKYQLKQAIEKEKDEISKRAWDKVKQQVDETKRDLDKQIELNALETSRQFEKDSLSLKLLYEKNREKWIDEITKRVIGERK